MNARRIVLMWISVPDATHQAEAACRGSACPHPSGATATRGTRFPIRQKISYGIVSAHFARAYTLTGESVRRRYPLARGATMLAAAAIVWGWIIAQSPRLIGTLTVHTAAATHAALTALAIAGGAVLVAVLPAFYLLYVLFGRLSPEVTE